jgi:hypothetical protein
MFDYRQHHVVVRLARRGVGGLTAHFFHLRSVRLPGGRYRALRANARNARLTAAKSKVVSARYRKREATGFPKRH